MSALPPIADIHCGDRDVRLGVKRHSVNASTSVETSLFNIDHIQPRQVIGRSNWTSADGMIRPCCCPASDRSWPGAPTTRSTPYLTWANKRHCKSKRRMRPPTETAEQIEAPTSVGASPFVPATGAEHVILQRDARKCEDWSGQHPALF
jgi:hypothetical protein